jgi:membrane-associated phospholipid phosphatase
VGLVVTGVLAYLVPVTRAGDNATLLGFTSLNRPRVTPLLDHVAHLCDPVSYGLIGFALASVALARRRPRVAGLVVGLLFATGWTTQTLKPLLASPRYDEWLGSGQIAAASWPSGHATAAMTLALCGMLVAPRRLRPTAAAVGALFATAVGYSILALGWHFPSDVLGGYLVAATWTALGIAGLLALEQRRPGRVRAERPPRPVDEAAPLAVGGAALAAALVITLRRPEEAGAFAVAHTASVIGAAGIAALAVGLALTLARSVRTA